MINVGKCPKCQGIIRNVKTEDISMDVGFQSVWKGFSYLCPQCSTVLSVEINPILLKEDMITGVVKALKGT